LADLRDDLRFDRHLEVPQTEEEKALGPREGQAADAANLLLFLTRNSSKLSDWHDLVKSDAHDDVQSFLSGYKEAASAMSILRPDSLPPKGQYYDLSIPRVLDMLKVDPAVGLNDDEVARRREKYGWNRLPQPPHVSALRLLMRQLTDFMTLVLLAAAALSFGIDETKSGIVLLVVVVINATIGFAQELQAERALSSLASLVVPQARIRRNGKLIEVDAAELVPGDIVDLDEGMSLPADLRLLEVTQLRVIEAVLTGESEAITKKTEALRVKKHPTLGDRINSGYMSTMVTNGRGVGIVTNTGITTEIGKISALVTSAQLVATPLQIKLARLGKWLVLTSIIVCTIIVLVGLFHTHEDDVVYIGISLAVSVIPEGLVTVVTLAMALGMKRMAINKAIVRKLPAVETLGSVTTICSDKTGTLTEGKMKMEALELSGAHCGFNGSGADPSTGGISLEPVSTAKDAPLPPTADSSLLPSLLSWSLMVCALNNNAILNRDDKTGEWKLLGDSTEIALAIGAVRGRRDVAYWKQYLERIFEFAFDSDRKRMSVLCKLTDDVIKAGSLANLPLPSGATHVLLVKGAAETITQHCHSHLAAVDAKTVSSPSAPLQILPMSDDDHKRVIGEGAALAKSGMRVLGFGVRFFTAEQAALVPTIPVHKTETDLIFAGLAGLRDPPRAAVPDAIRACKTAGIRVCMITGDHADTAVAIAKQIGIFEEGDRSLKGDILAAMPESKLSQLNPFPVVFSRVAPNDKMKIVKALQSLGEIVAMTGDGVNDAAAIKQASVGIAMGIAGTEITRQAADIVLADDNFATIVAAVKEGRHIFDNITKFIVYLLSCNSSEVFFMFIAMVAKFPVPFEAMAILWANIIADVPPSLSLGLEPAEDDIMTRNPRNPRKGVFSLTVGICILLNGLEIGLLTLGNYAYVLINANDDDLPWEDDHILGKARSVAFITMVTLQLIHSFACRSIRASMFSSSPLRNPWMVFAFCFSFLCTIGGIYWPGLAHWLEAEPLDDWHWLLIFIASVIHVTWMELQKATLRWMKERSKRNRARLGVGPSRVINPRQSTMAGGLGQGKSQGSLELTDIVTSPIATTTSSPPIVPSNSTFAPPPTEAAASITPATASVALTPLPAVTSSMAVTANVPTPATSPRFHE
jgi:Ca2+-transporting ATPase